MASIELPSLGWDTSFAHAFTPYAATHRPGRVAHVDRGAVGVLTETGACRALAASTHDATVGDWVALLDYEIGPSRIDAVLPRRTAIVRGSASGASTVQVLAANVDTVFVAVTITATPKPGLIERLVTLAWESGATPIIVLTKADAAGDYGDVVEAVTDAAPGVEVVAVSAHTGTGLGALDDHIGSGRTAAILGPSGVGKSTLVNRLVGADVLRTHEIRGDGKGRHTTVRRELVPMPAGGVLIDTPGLRGVALTDSAAALAQTFADVEELVDKCYFTDCRHDSEPGCAVLAALSDGCLPARRFESWQKLRREARWMATRADARLRAEERRKWRIYSKAVRRN